MVVNKNHLKKKFGIMTGCLISILFLFPTGIHAQTVPSLFVVVDYMKVKPENLNEYLKVEQEIWKPLHSERIKRGIIVGWYLYAVEFSGTNDEYNYVVVNLYDSADHLENPWYSDIPEKVHPNLSVKQIMSSTYEVRNTVKSELFYSIVTAPEIPLEAPASYMQVNYMLVDPGMQSEYEQLESEIWLPIHNESIKASQSAGWGLWKSLFPRGAGREYQYLTLNTFSDFSTVFGLDYSVAFEKLHSTKDIDEISNQTQTARTIVRSELWSLIDYVIR